MLHIRKAELADVAGICQVCAAGWRATYDGILTPAQIEATIAEFYNHERVRGEVLHPEHWNGWWVAREDDTVVGAGGGVFLAPHSSELYVLYVDPPRRGGGIGTALLNAITAELVQQGAREQRVAVEPNNQKGIPFYMARGFVVQETRPAHGEALAQQASLVLWRSLMAQGTVRWQWYNIAAERYLDRDAPPARAFVSFLERLFAS